MMPHEITDYARRRAIETCAEQGVSLIPDATTLAAAGALLAATPVRREVVHYAAA